MSVTSCPNKKSVDKKEQLIALKKKMQGDKSLPLRQGTTNLVFGEGSPNAEMFFLGEGPGYHEDRLGRPFVGNAGMLLNKLLQSIKVERRDVFITNVVCFRPPENRDPLPEEIAAFQPYIDEIISTVGPKVIVTLGRFSMGKFLPNVRISSVHGKVFKVNYGGKEVTVVPMFHPAAALRRNDVMIMIKNDFLRLPEIIKKIKSEKPKIEAKQMSLV
jgi:DNA polymerase